MAQSETPSATRSESGPQTPIRARLRVTPSAEASCAVADDSDRAVTGHDLKLSHSADAGEEWGCCGECHAVCRSGASGRETYVQDEVGKRCICPVFARHECLADIQAVESGALVVTLTLRHRDVLSALVSELQAVDASVTIEWLAPADGGDSTAEIADDEITQKQREAMEAALDAGYYESPRQTSLSELAAELSLSESAVSQRLNTAETRLIEALLGE